MKPTDDELEAMAARLYSDGDAEPVHPLFYDAAAMLRACKTGRVRVKPLKWEQARDGAGWHPQLSIAYCPVFEKLFYAERPEKQVKIDAAREARILSALDPDRDHAISAMCECGMHGPCMWNECKCSLKKGQTND